MTDDITNAQVSLSVIRLSCYYFERPNITEHYPYDLCDSEVGWLVAKVF